MPVAYNVPVAPRTADAGPTTVGSTYPVPQPMQHPKHLFHLILKAEGVGDLGTTGLVKDLAGVSDKEDAKETAKTEPAPGPRINPSVLFILRYEGEGIIDNTVADVLKEIYGPKNASKKDADGDAPGFVETIRGGLTSPTPATTRPPTSAQPAVPSAYNPSTVGPAPTETPTPKPSLPR